MEKYELTKKTIMEARTYLPLAEKMEFLSNAQNCFDRLRITDGKEEMPPMWKENAGLKARYLMRVLLVNYLGISCEEESDYLITEAEYDKYAGSHIIMQIERFKRDADKDARDTAYDLLSDYFHLEKSFQSEINALLGVQNDSIIRQQQMTKEAVALLPSIIEQLKELNLSDNKPGEISDA